MNTDLSTIETISCNNHEKTECPNCDYNTYCDNCKKCTNCECPICHEKFEECYDCIYYSFCATCNKCDMCDYTELDICNCTDFSKVEVESVSVSVKENTSNTN